MASNNVDLRAAMKMAPKDAVAYFRSKGYQISDQWQEIRGASHANAFTVAKAMRMDILQDIRNAVDEALAEGVTERDFTKRLAPKLKAKGWWGKETWKDAQGNDREVQLGSPWRLKTIYRTNLQTAYMAGRYRRQLASVSTRPYWQYVAVIDSRTRPSHRAMNGRVFRWDDPIWQYLYPPNGWGCRCRVRNLTERQVEREGLTVENGADYIEQVQREAGTNFQTGEVITMDHAVVNLPGGASMSPDVGWAYNPGAAAFGVDAGIAQKLGQVRSTELRSQVIQSLNNSELRQEQFAQWAQDVLANRRAGHGLASIGFLPEALASAVFQRTGKAPSRLLVIGEKQLMHADSQKHQDSGIALPLALYQELPRLMAKPQAVLWDKVKKNLVYVADAAEDSAYKVVVNAPYRLAKSEPVPLDVVVNAYQVRASDLLGSQYELVEGAL
ncbi:phage head morphogenesis protein [Marinobacter salarius]|uniref:phage head morphogenesis protein n=1 Tax=Marinobacter salarius TaxID=1420917 RepID=UPI0025A3C040|nr:phage minor head protein [Marinobacter salarius]MDM8181264.1 phage minor head protein [Marinobacter salarius]